MQAPRWIGRRLRARDVAGAFALAAILGTGCAPEIPDPVVGDVPTAGRDGGVVEDVGAPPDATTGSDGGAPELDVPVATDAPGSVDMPSTVDVPMALDAPVAMDVPPRVDTPSRVDAGVDLGLPPAECTAGQSRPCGSTTGACTLGTQSCMDGRWARCSGRGPVAELCHDGIDNDCDGSVDESCPCPTGMTLTVDNDLPGSGYREESPNWTTWRTDACLTSYRYLSHTVGDGSRRGRAIWQPTFRATGAYRVVTSYRASENRTTDADYYLEDDRGMRRHRSVNQQSGSGCTRVDLGLAWCRVGGSCRLVLDGTDDNQSDSADVTTFRLESCEGGAPPPPSACAGIAMRRGYELCFDGGDTCHGVFTDGSGCVAFCAAAGMVCTARYGGEPGCRRESGAPIPCNASNGHSSDWCECARR